MSSIGPSGNNRFDNKIGFGPSSNIQFDDMTHFGLSSYLVQSTGFGPSGNGTVCNNVFGSSARFAWIVPQQRHVFVIENNGVCT
jgi:hypothetical protein